MIFLVLTAANVKMADFLDVAVPRSVIEVYRRVSCTTSPIIRMMEAVSKTETSVEFIEIFHRLHM